MLKEHEACLIIGDEAITSSWEDGQSLYQYDLAYLWYTLTGLSMTFAVFAVRKSVYNEQREKVKMIWHEFIKSKNLSKNNKFRPMIDGIQKEFGGDLSFWNHYFKILCYGFNKKHIEGLEYYYKLAYKHQLYPKMPVISLASFDT
jgi:chorismate dehydratase